MIVLESDSSGSDHSLINYPILVAENGQNRVEIPVSSSSVPQYIWFFCLGGWTLTSDR